MDSPNELKKVSFFRGLFEIKRPSKSVQSATLPRTNRKSIDDGDVSKDRLFVRHNTYRTRRNKYKKENTKKQPDEKFIEKGENSVKQICQQFELVQTKEQNRLVQENKSEQNTKIDTEKEESPATVIERVIESSEAQLILLKKIHENAEVKKRIYEKNAKQTREKKIQSFVEAENDEEAEEYRKSLINEMDKELAQMKEDGFLDDDENVLIDGSQEQIRETDEVFSNEDNTFLSKMRLNNLNNDTFFYLPDIYSTEKEEEEVIVHDKEDHNVEKIQYEAALTDKFSNEFGENDDLKNGCEAINEIYAHDESKTFSFFHDMNKIKEETPNKEVRTVELCNKSDVENMRELMKQELATTSNNEAVYEYIEIPNENNPQSPFYIFAPISNRSTVYSTTSQESSVIDDDDDDEGIEICRTKDGEKVYHNVRRETFSDDKGIIRIERVADADSTPFIPEEVLPSLSRSNSSTPIKRLDFIIDEIKSTEKKYVEDLAKVVKLYKPYIRINTPSHLKMYEGYLFGNLVKIYRGQKKFLEAIENCQDVDQIVQCFIDHKQLFELYPTYFRNKPKSDNLIKDFNPIIKEMQEKFEERLDFSAYLLTPVQRLGKYILFLENIEKQLEKSDFPVANTQVALDIVRDEMSKGNDSVAIDSIENSPISKMDYGSFKMREKFNIIKPRKVEAAMVFLFTDVVVFTITDARSLETFYYYDSIKMNDLRIATFDDLTMHLTDFTKSKKKQNTSRYTYVLESKSEKIWKTWKDAIEKILWDQLFKAKENSLSNTVPHRRKSKINRNRIKSAGSSVFYCE